MNNILKKICIILIICVLAISLFQITSFAVNEGDDGSSEGTATAGNPEWRDRISKFDDAKGGNAQTSVSKVAGAILGIARAIGVGVAIIMLTVLAMKYMMAAPEEKANIKNSAVVYVVGAITLFAASGILAIIQQFAGTFNAT